MNEENGTFIPLIFSCNGGMSRETRKFFQRLSELISEKHNQNISETCAWVKRKLGFCSLRTAVCALEVQGFENIMSPLVKWVILTLETFYLVLLIRNGYLYLV